MMPENKIKLAITSVLFVVFIALVIVLMTMELDLGVFKTNSLSSLNNYSKELKTLQASLTNQDTIYKNSVKSIEGAQDKYISEKKKYDTISDETIEIIKEATTQENYNIEYMWVKLGNYAKKNNLSLILAEPGNTLPSNTTPEQTTTQGTDGTSPTATGTDNNATQTPNTNTSNNTLFKIQVIGTYIDVSEFIFEVENDRELRFKLDNIKMELVEGSNIKTTFDVKNLIIKK